MAPRQARNTGSKEGRRSLLADRSPPQDGANDNTQQKEMDMAADRTRTQAHWRTARDTHWDTLIEALRGLLA